MTGTSRWLAFVESNTSGTGRLFARAATRLGFRPVLCAANPAAYSFVGSDGLETIQVDTLDERAVLAACREASHGAAVAGVVSSSEYFVATAAAVARQLGLPGPVPESVRACRDKYVQRSLLSAAEVSIPVFRLARSAEAAVAAAEQLGLPVVVKPVSGSGSIGVKLAARTKDVAEHARSLLERARDDRGLPVPRQVLIEEFVAGPEYSVETFGESVVGITEKRLGPPPYFVEVGHDYPARVSECDTARICDAAVSAVRALQLGWGPAHTELRLAGGRATIIEVNPRLAGDYIPELIRLAQGVDLIAATICLAAKLDVVLHKTSDRHASIRFLLPGSAGTLSSVAGVHAARHVPGVVDVQVRGVPGLVLRHRGDFRDRIGHVIAVGDTPEAAREATANAVRQIRFTVTPPASPANTGRSDDSAIETARSSSPAS